jgi:hypothetical protein
MPPTRPTGNLSKVKEDHHVMSSCYAQVMLCNATYPIGCPAYRQEVGDEEKLGTKSKEEIEMGRVSGRERDEQQKCTTLAKRIENRSNRIEWNK